MTRVSLGFTLIRVLIALGVSFYHLQVYGPRDLPYPFLTFFVSLTLLPIWDSLYDWKNWTTNDGNGQNRNAALEIRRIRGNCSTPRSIFICSVRLFFLILTLFSAIWQIIVVLSYSDYNYYQIGKHRFYNHDSRNATPSNSQFITQCLEMPTTSEETLMFCTPSDKAFSCLFSFGKVFDFEFKTRMFATVVLIGYIVLLMACNFICCMPSSLIPFRSETYRERCNKFISKEVPFRPKFGRFVLLVVAVFSASYLVFVGVIQSQGLNVQGLEKCDLDLRLLGSKTGYIKEWTVDKVNTARHIALL